MPVGPEPGAGLSAERRRLLGGVPGQPRRRPARKRAASGSSRKSISASCPAESSWSARASRWCGLVARAAGGRAGPGAGGGGRGTPRSSRCPPHTWIAASVTSRAASAHQALATRAAVSASAGPSASAAQAACQQALRAASMVTSWSAHRCWTAWNEPIGRPNCSRSRACVDGRVEGAPPSPRAGRRRSGRGRRRATLGGPPARSCHDRVPGPSACRSGRHRSTPSSGDAPLEDHHLTVGPSRARASPGAASTATPRPAGSVSSGERTTPAGRPAASSAARAAPSGPAGAARASASTVPR